MDEHRLPEFPLEIGRATRLVDGAVRVILVLVGLAAAGAAVLVFRGDLGGLDGVVRTLRALLGGGGG